MRNGTDFAKGEASHDKVLEMKKKYNIADDESVFLYVGRVEWYKNLKLSLNALKRLKASGRKFKFLIVGKGIFKEEIEDFSIIAGLENEVIFTGPMYDREDLRTLYTMSDLLLFPSTFDTAGLVVMEAAACNCPSILIKGSCAAETAIDKRNAILCEENIASLSDAISYAISDKDRLREIGKNASGELYLSFEDAVKLARERYEYLIEKISK
jgi:glycosyltransferase involved in cell wall biosynthesis